MFVLLLCAVFGLVLAIFHSTRSRADRDVVVDRAEMTLGNGNGSGGSLIKGASGSKPNILLIITDDQEKTSMRAMPQTLDLFKRHGVNFNHGYVTTPLCCPARASMYRALCPQPRDHHQQPAEAVRHHLSVAGHLPGEAPGRRLSHRPVR